MLPDDNAIDDGSIRSLLERIDADVRQAGGARSDPLEILRDARRLVAGGVVEGEGAADGDGAIDGEIEGPAAMEPSPGEPVSRSGAVAAPSEPEVPPHARAEQALAAVLAEAARNLERTMPETRPEHPLQTSQGISRQAPSQPPNSEPALARLPAIPREAQDAVENPPDQAVVAPDATRPIRSRALVLVTTPSLAPTSFATAGLASILIATGTLAGLWAILPPAAQIGATVAVTTTDIKPRLAEQKSAEAAVPEVSDTRSSGTSPAPPLATSGMAALPFSGLAWGERSAGLPPAPDTPASGATSDVAALATGSVADSATPAGPKSDAPADPIVRRIETKPGARLALPVSLGPAQATAEVAAIVVRGLPPMFTIEGAVRSGDGSWVLNAQSLATARLEVPADAAGDVPLALELFDTSARTVGAPQYVLAIEPALATRALEPERIETMMARGRLMLASGDTSAARLLFERVAEAGDARGAFALAESYDHTVQSAGAAAAGAAADASRARFWYRRAFDGGIGEAASRLEALDRESPGSRPAPGL